MVGKSWAAGGRGRTKAAIAPAKAQCLTFRCPILDSSQSDRLSAPGEGDKRSWMMVLSRRRKGVPIVKARSRRHSFREIQKVLHAVYGKGKILNVKVIPYFGVLHQYFSIISKLLLKLFDKNMGTVSSQPWLMKESAPKPRGQTQTNQVRIWMAGLGHQHPVTLAAWFSCSVIVTIDCLSRKQHITAELAEEMPPLPGWSPGWLHRIL